MPRSSRGTRICRERGIESIDFLKIDVEGGEQRVLAGFDGLLAAHAIKAIQFEYGLTNIVSRVFLADLYDRLGAHGYAIGKIFPKRVDFTPYDGRQHEDCAGRTSSRGRPPESRGVAPQRS